MGIVAYTLCSGLAVFEAARSDEHGEPVSRQILGDLESDPFIGAGDEGDKVVVHGDPIIC